jgi:HEAT repeat protein
VYGREDHNMWIPFKRTDTPDRLHRDAVKGHLKALRSPDPHSRSDAARALGELHAGEDGLKAALLDSEHEVRGAVVKSLALIGWQPATQGEKVAWILARGSVPEETELDDSGIDLLARAAGDGDLPDEVRNNAVRTLASRWNEQAIATLVRGLSHPVIGKCAEDAIVHIGAPAVPALSQMARADPNKLAREWAWATPGYHTIPWFLPHPDASMYKEMFVKLVSRAKEVLDRIQSL